MSGTTATVDVDEDTDHRLTIPASELRDLLGEVRTAASDGDGGTLPMLAGVLLQTESTPNGPMLVATATDRFRALQGAVPITGSIPRTWLTLDQIREVRAILKETGELGQAEVTVADGAVTFRRNAATVHGSSASVTVPHRVMRDFPDVGQLIVKHTADPASAEPVAFSGGLLAELIALARPGGYRYATVRLHLTGKEHPVVLFIGEHLTGLVMPSRGAEELPLPPCFATPQPPRD